ncbi:hypothetical protein, partial [Pantoea ananatis]
RSDVKHRHVIWYTADRLLSVGIFENALKSLKIAWLSWIRWAALIKDKKRPAILKTRNAFKNSRSRAFLAPILFI